MPRTESPAVLERSSPSAAIKKRLVFLFECLSNVLAHWVALPHRQQWRSRCRWMGALSRPAASDSLAFHSAARYRGPSSRTTSSPSSVGGRRQVVSDGRQVVRSDGQPSLFASWPAELPRSTGAFYPPKKAGFCVFGARLNLFYPSILSALVDSAHQAAADLIWQSKVSLSCAKSRRRGAPLPQEPRWRSWRRALCFSGGYDPFPQFNQAWNPFGQTRDWFPFESFSDKEKKKKRAGRDGGGAIGAE